MINRPYWDISKSILVDVEHKPTQFSAAVYVKILDIDTKNVCADWIPTSKIIFGHLTVLAWWLTKQFD